MGDFRAKKSLGRERRVGMSVHFETNTSFCKTATRITFFTPYHIANTKVHCNFHEIWPTFRLRTANEFRDFELSCEKHIIALASTETGT